MLICIAKWSRDWLQPSSQGSSLRGSEMCFVRHQEVTALTAPSGETLWQAVMKQVKASQFDTVLSHTKL